MGGTCVHDGYMWWNAAAVLRLLVFSTSKINMLINMLVWKVGSCADLRSFYPFCTTKRPLFPMFTARCSVTIARPGTCKCREGKLRACNAVQERRPPPRKGNCSVTEVVTSNVQVMNSEG